MRDRLESAKTLPIIVSPRTNRISAIRVADDDVETLVAQAQAWFRVTEARIITEWWRTACNTCRPHSSLGDRTPNQFHQDWTNQQQPLP